MKAHLYIISVLAIASGVIPVHAAHYRVYLLGGQSNASGRGDASELAAPLALPQTDVRFYWHKELDTTNGNLTQDVWTALQPDSGQGRNSPSGHAVEFGSELSFGRTMADSNAAVNIAIIKFAYGGSNLHTQWAASGNMYAHFTNTVAEGLAALTSSNHTYEMGGMIWIQGESDTSSTNNANAYATNLSNLIDRVRTDLFGAETPGGYTLPFLISRLSDSQVSQLGEGSNIVRQAQETVATNGRQTAFVDTDGLSTYGPGAGAIHFDATAQIAIGEACAQQMLILEGLDADRDGLLLEEEITYNTNPGLADTDDDGQPDGVEVAAGTDPTSATSRFQVVSIGVVTNEVTLCWPSRPGNRYSVEQSTNLAVWAEVDSGLDAEDPGSNTRWTGTLGATAQNVLALYDAETGVNSNFNSTAFDSVDTETRTTASRMAQGGSLSGGGSSTFVLNNALFNTSDSGSPGFNLADCNLADQAAAATNGDTFSFDLQSNGNAVTYEALSFYSDQFGTSAVVDVSYRIGADTEVFVLQNYTPAVNNASVVLENVDFVDFTTDETVTWTIYLYAASSAAHGIRFDDIKLLGTVSDPEVETVSAQFFRIKLTETPPF